MKNSTKIWGLIGAAAMIAPVGLSAPALADGGKDGRQINSPALNAHIARILNKTTMGNRSAGRLSSFATNSRSPSLNRLLEWHEVMLDANALDHTPSSGVAGDQQGPVRNSRAFAIIQIAVFDAVNSFSLKYQSFSRGIRRAPAGASVDAAISEAAYRTLIAMYPLQTDRLTALYNSDQALIQGTEASKAAGRAVGLAAANAILDARLEDGAGPAGTSAVVDFGAGGAVATGGTNIFGEPVNGGETAAPRWAPDRGPADDGVVPEIRNAALGANWGAVTPFVLRSGAQFRIPAYPAQGSPRYLAAYRDVFRNGGEDILGVVGTNNTAAKQFIGNYWGYDGAPALGTPPRLYNQIAVTVADARGLTNLDDYSRLLALVNVTMGDSGIAAWDSKYFHNYWRPGNGIRDDDGVPGTRQLDSWRPFGASVINEAVPERFTPPFPAIRRATQRSALP
ncbi:MAG: vanadium-dependent haloperoxidase [Rhizobiales bacterium]|nr:vanadium-dependent haloperoxidase [Hyphomicrobiales bacterium]